MAEMDGVVVGPEMMKGWVPNKNQQSEASSGDIKKSTKVVASQHLKIS